MARSALGAWKRAVGVGCLMLLGGCSTPAVGPVAGGRVVANRADGAVRYNAVSGVFFSAYDVVDGTYDPRVPFGGGVALDTCTQPRTLGVPPATYLDVGDWVHVNGQSLVDLDRWAYDPAIVYLPETPPASLPTGEFHVYFPGTDQLGEEYWPDALVVPPYLMPTAPDLSAPVVLPPGRLDFSWEPLGATDVIIAFLDDALTSYQSLCRFEDAGAATIPAETMDSLAPAGILAVCARNSDLRRVHQGDILLFGQTCWMQAYSIGSQAAAASVGGVVRGLGPRHADGIGLGLGDPIRLP